MGITALHFTRARYYDSDYARAARQQQVIRALARKYSDPETDVRIGRLLGTVAGLETNLPLEDLKTLDGDGAARQPAPASAWKCSRRRQFALGWGDQHDGRGWVIIPNVEAMRAEIRTLLGD